ncbi:hypothetical protein H072_164 [Dactylellina haptotyla CBS 200.50]|uniref:Uncharacterized protein n=1 Tax=Dactylellina haptotyla (strain CBS 200.50) TaxID=1284197 RepID=S8AXU8_DACHA|nr:hypothetical protein H072_164 [Dactylellina haptotyla CBS 200.50]
MTNSEIEFRRQRAEFYHNAIPLATRNGDLDAVETAYDRLIQLARTDSTQTGGPTTDDAFDRVSTLNLALAGKRQVLGTWQTALDALDHVNEGFLDTHKDHAVSYWQIKALIYLGMNQIDSAEEASVRALDLAREVPDRAGEKGLNTGYLIMSIIMARKEDRMEAAFYKSLVKETGELDNAILERQWKEFDAINGDFGVKVASKRGYDGDSDGNSNWNVPSGAKPSKRPTNESRGSRGGETKGDGGITDPGFASRGTVLVRNPNPMAVLKWMTGVDYRIWIAKPSSKIIGGRVQP